MECRSFITASKLSWNRTKDIFEQGQLGVKNEFSSKCYPNYLHLAPEEFLLVAGITVLHSNCKVQVIVLLRREEEREVA